MAESIERLEGPQKDWEADGTEPIITDDGDVFATYIDTDLYTAGAARRLCVRHLNDKDGTVAAIEQKFRDEQRILPADDEPKLIRYRRECFGCDALGQCGMKIVQYNVEGERISK
jgi:hypothetical protein